MLSLQSSTHNCVPIVFVLIVFQLGVIFVLLNSDTSSQAFNWPYEFHANPQAGNQSQIRLAETMPNLRNRINFNLSTCQNLSNGIVANSVGLSTSNNSSLTRSNLNVKYEWPLYLYSFGGSGNTWTRILLEYITGIATGAMHPDNLYKSIFVHEGHCNEQLLVCKCHAIWFYKQQPKIEVDVRGKFANYGVPNKQQSLMIRNASGLVWLIRDPWHAIWSLYQLRRSRSFSTGATHSGHLRKDQFDAERFWTDIYVGYTELPLVEKWKIQFEIAKVLLVEQEVRHWNGEHTRIVRIRYEDLVDRDKQVWQMWRVINHLYHLNHTKMSNHDADYFRYANRQSGVHSLSYNQLLHRIWCAFHYTDVSSGKFHRKHQVDDMDDYVSMHEAYTSLGKERICKLWHSLKPYAERVGYTQLFSDQFDCQRLPFWQHIVDMDNLANPNLTRFQHNIEVEEQKRAKKRKFKKPEDPPLTHWNISFDKVL